MPRSQQALIVIDVQNDYFPQGKFPLWNALPTLERIELAIARAQALGVAVVLVQHIAASSQAPFFQPNTLGAELHPRIRAAAPVAPVVVKAHADSFFATTLEATLQALGAQELLVCGMMTQNCVTHTAISKAAEKYRVSVLPDACTTVSEPIHLIALNALTTRLALLPSEQALAA